MDSFFYIARRSISDPVDVPNLNRWYDPSDSGTLTLVGGEVDVMADKSGNGHSIAAPASSRRCALTTINGIQALNHNSDYLSDPAVVPDPLPGIGGDDAPFTWFEVCQPANITQNSTYHMSMNSGSTDLRALMQHSTTGIGMRIRDGGGTTKDAMVASILDTTPQLLTMICHGTTVDLRRNGVLILTAGDVDVATTAANRFTLGAFNNPPGNSNFYIGKMGECSLYERALSAGEIAAMEAYLATKWGITI